MTTAIEKVQQPTGMELLDRLSRTVTDPQMALEIAKKACDLQVQMEELQQNRERFDWERAARQDKIDFNSALARCQAKIPQIKGDGWNKHTSSWWMRYETIDAVIRPIYTEEGFSLSFGERDSPIADKIRIVAYLSRGIETREFFKDVTPPNLGAKGGAVMSATHGDAAANSYGRRYLVCDIFNIAKAIGDRDTDGNPIPPMDADDLARCLKDIENAKDINAVRDFYRRGTEVAREARDDDATLKILKAYEEAKKRLAPGAKQ